MKHFDNKKKSGVFHPATGRHFENEEAVQNYLKEKKGVSKPKDKPKTEYKKKTEPTEDK